MLARRKENLDALEKELGRDMGPAGPHWDRTLVFTLQIPSLESENPINGSKKIRGCYHEERTTTMARLIF